MAAQIPFSSGRAPRPALATTWEGAGGDLLDRILPLVDYLEIPPDSIAHPSGGRTRLRPEIMDRLAAASAQVGLLLHGDGLSLGSGDQWNGAYLQLLDEFFSRLTPRWHSEHLGFTTVAGESLGAMLALPRTEEMLDLVCERIRRIQQRYPAPFLVEHTIRLLPDAPAHYTPAGFLNQVAWRTGCGLILDAWGLECDQNNCGLDVLAFLDELDLTCVRELHLAGGLRHRGVRVDLRWLPTADSTLILGAEIIRRCPGLQVVTWEFEKGAIPDLGAAGICQELRRIRKAVASC